MTDEIQEDLSNGADDSLTADDLKAAWERGEELPQQEADESEDTEESVEEGEVDEEQPKAASFDEPIVLRKQKARLKRELDAANAELARFRQIPVSAEPVMPSVPLDPTTGQPIDENSVQGQVYKALNGIALQHKQAEVKRQHEQQQAVMQKQYQDFQESLEAASDEYADFEEVVLASHVPITPAMRDAALMLPNGAATLYKIAKNKIEFDRIRSLTPFEQAREMVKASAGLLGQSKSVKASNAPRPLSKIANNPTKAPTRGINEKSSVSEIRAYLNRKTR